MMTEVISLSFQLTDRSIQLCIHTETLTQMKHISRPEKNKLISPNYVAHQPKASSPAYKIKHPDYIWFTCLRETAAQF